MNKTEIAAVLTDIGTLLELKGENPFKIRAYQSGARLLETLSEETIAEHVRAATLSEVKGIGDALAQKISELHTTGRLDFYEKLKSSIPPGLIDMLSIAGVGPKKVKALHEKLGIDSLAALQQACIDGKIAELDGFGQKSQDKILEGIRNQEAYGRRHLWIDAWETAEPILTSLRALPEVERAEHAGSLRRRTETVGDLDFLVATKNPKPVVAWFVAQPGVREITAQGETKASVRLTSGIQADLRLVPIDRFVFALHHFTGSKDHNVQMRQRALTRGLSMSEWGLFPADEKHGPSGKEEKPETGKLKVENRKQNTAASVPGLQVPAFESQVSTEADLFAALGLAFVPPELREGLGEIEAAEQGTLPTLVEPSDVRGVFHNHTTESDGHNTLEEMAAAAQMLGLDYLGIADHSKSSVQARGLSEARLVEQVAAIARLNASRRFTCHVFSGTECDILPDGSLDFSDDVLATLDYVVVSIHSAFKQVGMTERIIRAIEHPRATMLGHLTGRLFLKREGYTVDTEKIIDAAIANDVIIELNANPLRLDMDWRLWRKAADKGLRCSINPDAHDTAGLAYFRTGVAAARKGWLTKDVILNCRPLDEVKNWLSKRKARR